MASERKFVIENIRRALLKEYIRKETERAGFGGLDIQRTPMGTRIILTAERPGMIIGRKGGTIKELTDNIESKFKFDNPRIEVQEDPDPALNPHIMAQKLASALERGWHFRRAGHSTVRRIMDAGARGCQVVISGKLTGERHRTEKFREGHVKYCGETQKVWMKNGFAVAKKKPGIIGIKVQIMDKNARLPDEVHILTVEEKLKMDGKAIPVPGAEPAAIAAEAKPAEPGVPIPEGGAAPTAPVKPTKEVDIADTDVGETFAIDEKDIKDKKKLPVPGSKRKERRKDKAAKVKDEDKPEIAPKAPEVKTMPVAPPAVQPKVEPKKEEPKPVAKPPSKPEEPKPVAKPPSKPEEPKPVAKAPPKPEEPKPTAPAGDAKPAEKKKSDDLDDLLSKLETDLKS
jgi:small subunit ribosomal protein S3